MGPASGQSAIYALYRRLLQIRHEQIIPRLPGAHPLGAEVLAPGAVTGDDFSGRHVHRVVYGPTDVTQNINGVAGVAAAAVPTTGAARVTIGRSTTGSGPWNGKLRDIVVTDLLTPDQAAAMLAWAMPRRML